MTTQTLTDAQVALRNYYRAILALEDNGVISDTAGDVLSATMMSWVGEYDEYDGTMYTG